MLINGENQVPHKLYKAIADILDNGYTYEDVMKQIIICFNNHEMFPFYRFKNKQNKNLLKQGIRYYHKELNIMSKLNPIHHNVDTGIITSQGNEYWIEPRASYTLEELINYMYSKNMIDKDEFPTGRMHGLIKSMVNQYGLEILLFMIEHASRMHDSDHRMFNVREFDTYHSIAVSYFEEAKNNCTYSGGADYVPRKRMLFS